MKHFAANSFSCEEGAASACYHGAVNGVMNEERSSGHIRLREGQVGLFPLFTNFHAIPDLEKRLWLRNFIYPVTIQFIPEQYSESKLQLEAYISRYHRQKGLNRIGRKYAEGSISIWGCFWELFLSIISSVL